MKLLNIDKIEINKFLWLFSIIRLHPNKNIFTFQDAMKIAHQYNSYCFQNNETQNSIKVSFILNPIDGDLLPYFDKKSVELNDECAALMERYLIYKWKSSILKPSRESLKSLNINQLQTLVNIYFK